MAERGIDVVSFEGDSTSVWLPSLDPLWRSRAVPVVAGLTAEQALFCIECLAWDLGLRVVQRQGWSAARR